MKTLRLIECRCVVCMKKFYKRTKKKIYLRTQEIIVRPIDSVTCSKFCSRTYANERVNTKARLKYIDRLNELNQKV